MWKLLCKLLGTKSKHSQWWFFFCLLKFLIILCWGCAGKGEEKIKLANEKRSLRIWHIVHVLCYPNCFLLKPFSFLFIASNGIKQTGLWFQRFTFAEFCFNVCPCLTPYSSFNDLRGKLHSRMIPRQALPFWIWDLTSFKREPRGQISCSQLGAGFKGTGVRSGQCHWMQFRVACFVVFTITGLIFPALHSEQQLQRFGYKLMTDEWLFPPDNRSQVPRMHSSRVGFRTTINISCSSSNTYTTDFQLRFAFSPWLVLFRGLSLFWKTLLQLFREQTQRSWTIRLSVTEWTQSQLKRALEAIN